MRKQLVITLALATACSTPAAAASLDVNLDFAALNQSQWSPGPAVNENAEYRFPDPYFSANVNLGRVELDPVGTLLGFIGDFLGIPLVTGASIAPRAAITTGFDAGYHVNSGSIDLAYPTQVILSLPDQVNYGETFTVSAQPFSGAASASPYRSVDLAGLLGTDAADKLSRFSTVGSNPGQLAPHAGFTTRFPYAEANLAFHLDASAQLNAEASTGACPRKPAESVHWKPGTRRPRPESGRSPFPPPTIRDVRTISSGPATRTSTPCPAGCSRRPLRRAPAAIRA
ncbi:MAG: hypothetical protein LT106_04755 [Burkholderiaceae bacterium]|nr:hypothetical protein [Burkholderiaceae bacterium]